MEGTALDATTTFATTPTTTQPAQDSTQSWNVPAYSSPDPTWAAQQKTAPTRWIHQPVVLPMCTYHVGDLASRLPWISLSPVATDRTSGIPQKMWPKPLPPHTRTTNAPTYTQLLYVQLRDELW